MASNISIYYDRLVFCTNHSFNFLLMHHVPHGGRNQSSNTFIIP